MRRSRSLVTPGFIGRLFAFTLIFAAGVVAFEIAARIFLPNNVEALRRRAFGDSRVLFVTHASYADKDGYYNFRPSIEYTEVAYYPDHQGKATREYECSYRSDALGFLSNSIAYR